MILLEPPSMLFKWLATSTELSWKSSRESCETSYCLVDEAGDFIDSSLFFILAAIAKRLNDGTLLAAKGASCRKDGFACRVGKEALAFFKLGALNKGMLCCCRFVCRWLRGTYTFSVLDSSLGDSMMLRFDAYWDF